MGLTDNSVLPFRPSYQRCRIFPAMEGVRGNQRVGIEYIEANS